MNHQRSRFDGRRLTPLRTSYSMTRSRSRSAYQTVRATTRKRRNKKPRYHQSLEKVSSWMKSIEKQLGPWEITTESKLGKPVESKIGDSYHTGNRQVTGLKRVPSNRQPSITYLPTVHEEYMYDVGAVTEKIPETISSFKLQEVRYDTRKPYVYKAPFEAPSCKALLKPKPYFRRGDENLYAKRLKRNVVPSTRDRERMITPLRGVAVKSLNKLKPIPAISKKGRASGAETKRTAAVPAKLLIGKSSESSSVSYGLELDPFKHSPYPVRTLGVPLPTRTNKKTAQSITDILTNNLKLSLSLGCTTDGVSNIHDNSPVQSKTPLGRLATNTPLTRIYSKTSEYRTTPLSIRPNSNVSDNYALLDDIDEDIIKSHSPFCSQSIERLAGRHDRVLSKCECRATASAIASKSSHRGDNRMPFAHQEKQPTTPKNAQIRNQPPSVCDNKNTPDTIKLPPLIVMCGSAPFSPDEALSPLGTDHQMHLIPLHEQPNITQTRSQNVSVFDNNTASRTIKLPRLTITNEKTNSKFCIDPSTPTRGCLEMKKQAESTMNTSKKFIRKRAERKEFLLPHNGMVFKNAVTSFPPKKLKTKKQYCQPTDASQSLDTTEFKEELNALVNRASVCTQPSTDTPFVPAVNVGAGLDLPRAPVPRNGFSGQFIWDPLPKLVPAKLSRLESPGAKSPTFYNKHFDTLTKQYKTSADLLHHLNPAKEKYSQLGMKPVAHYPKQFKFLDFDARKKEARQNPKLPALEVKKPLSATKMSYGSGFAKYAVQQGMKSRYLLPKIDRKSSALLDIDPDKMELIYYF